MSGERNEIVGAVNHLKGNGMLKIVIIGAVVGVVLLLLGSFAFKDKGGADQTNNNSAVGYESFLRYKEMIEEEIEGISMRVSGVSDVAAIVYFDGVGESVYAQNVQSGNTDKSEYVIIGSGSSSHALYVGESLPPISGIAVVCRTGNNAGVRNEIAALLSSAYGLSLTRVHITEGK